MTSPYFTSLSLGAGPPSSALAIAIADRLKREVHPGLTFDFGALKVDLLQFADTGDELDATYAHLPRLAAYLEPRGMKLEIVRASHGKSLSQVWFERMAGLRRSAPALPLYLKGSLAGDGQARQQCTSEFKSRVLDANTKRRARAAGVRSGVRVLMGYLIEEWQRMKTLERYTKWGWDRGYPLIDAKANRGWSEDVCRAALGYVPVSSACDHCAHRPSVGPGSRAWIKENEPHRWEKIIRLDAALRHPPGIDAESAYIAAERLPVEEALVAAQRQGSLFPCAADGCGV